jgi:SAM-dependent methyltransferase
LLILQKNEMATTRRIEFAGGFCVDLEQPSQTSLAPGASTEIWSRVWSTSYVLGGLLLRLCSDTNGTSQNASHGPTRLLEIGAGLGIPSLVAAKLSEFSHVTAMEFSKDAVELLQRNASPFCFPATFIIAALNASTVNCLVHNWYVALDAAHCGKYDWIIASDVLYMSAALSPVARLLKDASAPGSIALVIDPGRCHWPDFLDACDGAELRYLIFKVSHGIQHDRDACV